MSDRQTTFESQSGINKEEVKKLLLINGNGPAIAASGDTELFKALFEEIRRSADQDCSTVSNSNIIESLEKVFLPTLANKAKSVMGDHSNPLDNICLLVVRFQGEQIVITKMHGLLKDSIGAATCDCIGSGKNAVGSLLVIETSDLTKEQILFWGEEIIRQVAVRDYRVGPPEYHGVDFIIAHQNGKFEVGTIPPKIKKMADFPIAGRKGV